MFPTSLANFLATISSMHFPTVFSIYISCHLGCMNVLAYARICGPVYMRYRSGEEAFCIHLACGGLSRIWELV